MLLAVRAEHYQHPIPNAQYLIPNTWYQAQSFTSLPQNTSMNNFFRALIAGYGAKKLGGGCLGTIVVFILIWVALGQCSFSSPDVPAPQTFPAKLLVKTPPELLASSRTYSIHPLTHIG